jgi:hypothetical protein
MPKNPDPKWKKWLRQRLDRIAPGEWGCTVSAERSKKFGGLETTIHLVCRPGPSEGNGLRGEKLPRFAWSAYVTVGPFKFESISRHSEVAARTDIENQMYDLFSSLIHFLNLGTENDL